MEPSMATTAGDRQRRGVRLAAADWLAQAHPAGLMHGAVVMGAVLALVSDHEEPMISVTGTAATILVVYWLTHAYADALSRGITGDRRHLTKRLVRSARHETAVLLGGLPALLTFALFMGFGASFVDAIDAALWLTLLMLTGAGYLAAHLAGITRWRLVGETAFAFFVGGLMVTLNSLLH
ncbi:MAG TPA: hypothetical protein VNP20_03105 [Nocardioidaceae bacterium]|nr:hypothetical protein [Nocardioidaceae bacterium]